MKILLFFIVLLLSNITKAQNVTNTTYGKTANIIDKNNKVIAKMAVIPGLRSELFLKSYSQNKDLTGSYISRYTFIRPAHLETKSILLILQFNKQFNNIYFDTEGEVTNIKTVIADNKSGASFQASGLAADATITIKVTSKKPALATITGIIGQLPPDNY